MHRNITSTLFQRQIGVHQDSYDYWKLRLEVDFGLKIAQKSTRGYCHLLYQNHSYYCEHLKSAIIKLQTIRQKDVIQFLQDANIGNGRIQKELLEILLSKPGGLQACCYVDITECSALTYAAMLPNKECFELIKDKLGENNASVLQGLLETKDMVEKTPLDYERKKESTNSNSNSNSIFKTSGGDYLFKFALFGDIDSLKAAITSLGDQAKETCLQSHDRFRRNILHAVAISGSIECLRLIIETLGKDIEKLYCTDSYKETAVSYAAQYGSSEQLELILQRSPFSLAAELLDDEQRAPSKVVTLAMYSGDIGKIQLILNLLKPYKDVVQQKYANDRIGSLSLSDSSAAHFYLLKEFIEFEEDCVFMRKFNKDHKHASFSLYCMVTDYLHELELRSKKTMK